ncbi:MAG: TrmH family RNA methyltransferase [Alphaproteobacteria bacterium]|nr:TrmH family RNA methyltransferase [Alphaproteobacteria bacterium]
MVSLALYQPEIPQNTGTLMRLSACFDMEFHIIEPCGFVWNDKKLSRSVMDYKKMCRLIRHLCWDDFLQYVDQHDLRIVLIDVAGQSSLWDFKFQENDILLMGSESCGVPYSVYTLSPQSVHIPQKQGRSLNLALAASLVLGQALRPD